MIIFIFIIFNTIYILYMYKSIDVYFDVYFDISFDVSID